MKRTRLKVRNLSLDQIAPGMFACYDTVLGKREVNAFAGLTGDVSPLHVDRAYGRRMRYRGNLVHGMLAACHFSTLVGVLLPGRRALLSHLEIDFARPIAVGERVTVSGKVSRVSRITSAIGLNLFVLCRGEICVSGKATVVVRPA